MHLFQKAVVTACCCTLLCGQCSALTTNSIRAAYGYPSVEEAAPLRKELARLSQSIRSTKEVELYNRILAETSTDKLDAEIDALQKSVTADYQVAAFGYDASYADLVSAETSYHAGVAKLDALLGARDSLYRDPKPEPDIALEELYAQRQSVTESLAKAADFKSIGSSSYYPVIGKEYRVNSGFGSRWDPVTNDRVSYHAGVDLYAPMRTPVGAWFTGIVENAGFSRSSGNYVWLQHGNGVRSFYCHLSEIKCKKGDTVRQGQVIALSGNTGYRTTGPHLHLGLYIDGTAVDGRVILCK